MSEDRKMSLKLLSTGIPGLDEVLGGGLPEYSFNLLAGAPGCGKTTLVHQLTFANASEARPALYFTVVGEPPLKMLRYQQQMAFFDPEKAGTVIRFVDLGSEVLTGDLTLVLEKIVQHVESTSPGIVVVDSFRTVLRAKSSSTPLVLEEFLQKLAVHLTTWQVTSFLVGEYGESEVHDNPVFTVADGIVWLSQHRDRNAVVRKLDVVKMRGVASLPGLHTFRIGPDGLRVFPRASSHHDAQELAVRHQRHQQDVRAAFGVPGLDEMLDGGLPVGDATLVAGPSGAGKSMLATHFITEGLRRGESGVLAIFEEHAEDYLDRAESLGFELRKMRDAGSLRVVYLRRLDLSAEEILFLIQDAVTEVHATRLVIDSLNGVELALAPTYREDFREALFRLVGHLTKGGVSVLMTVEILESFNDISFSPHAISFLSQNIIFIRYVEVESRLRRMVAIVKMRRSRHSSELRELEVTPTGARIRGTFRDLQGVLTGVATLRADADTWRTAGLTRREHSVLTFLQGAAEASESQLVEATGLAIEELQRALRRLLELNYVLSDTQASEPVYRVLERPLGR
jgi:circadian clock protein KaiC